MEEKILLVLQTIQNEPKTFTFIQQETQIEKEILKIILDELHRNNVIQNILIQEDQYFLMMNYSIHSNENTKENEMIEEEKNEILQLHKEILELNRKIEMNEKNSKESLNKVHEYNDIKDIGQMLLGKLGQLENKTIMELYDEYNIDLND